MENKEIKDATSSRRLQRPVYPGSRTTTDVPHARNSHPKHYSRRRPSQHKPAAAAHFSSQADTGSKVYQLPPSPLSRMTQALAGGAGATVVDRSNAISPSNQAPRLPLPQTTHVSGGDSGGVIDGFRSSACDASHGALPGFSCYQMPPPSSAAPMALDPISMLSGGVDGSESSSSSTIPRYATFLSSLDTGLASVVGLTPFTSSVDLQASSSYSSPPLLTQSTASVVDRSNTISPSKQAPRSPLPQTTHASGGDSGGFIGGFGSSACDASHGALPGFSCYQMPPSSSAAPMALDPISKLGGGVDGSESSTTTTIPCYATFLSSLDTGLASVVGLTALSSSVDLQASSSYSSPPLLTQSTGSVDFGWTDQYELPPLPPSLSGPPPLEKPMVIDLEAVRPAPVYIDDDNDSGKNVVQYVDLEGPGGGLNSSGRATGNSSIKSSCPQLSSSSSSLLAPAPADAWVKKEPVDWSSLGMSPLGNNTIASSDSGRMPHPYSSGNTGLTQASWTPVPVVTSSNSLPAPAANFGVKKEALDWIWHTSQLGKNTITSRGSSSAWMPQPYSGNTGNGITQAPWTPVPLTSSSPIPAPAAKTGVKKEPVDSSWHTSKLGKNSITSGGRSSAWMPQPAYSSVNKDIIFAGSKQNLLSSPGTGWGSGAPGSSIQYKDDPNSPYVATFADGSFTQNDINKIMGEKGLLDIVLRDPKRVRSILRNRITAGRSKQKKVEYLSELEHKVELLRKENKSLSANVNSLQCTTISLRSEKNKMMIKLHGFEQQKQVITELNETLNAEVSRLKLAAGEIRGSHVSSSSSSKRWALK